ncbi:hypothetical protein [Synechococcus sp. RSCCF101]|uniref:hypothetical protein n=1 Tax=Synechococcus sp. RSCCF101 TaxID=2511069 RepID=UPI001CDA08C6|nr:hypothetical protein [Synechococcus sp. RSCCF101]
MALAPPLPRADEAAAPASVRPVAAVASALRYAPDDEVYALDLDPRRVAVSLFEGWDREPEAFADTGALAFVSGPMYENHIRPGGEEFTVPLGDLKLGSRIVRGLNRSAARQRAYIAIRPDGALVFSYGELTPERANRYDTFIGGLHSLYNDLEAPPDTYRGAYSAGMGQRIRYHLPRIRMVMGLREDGRLEVLMSREGLTLDQTRSLARRRGFLAAYMPDHASKSRLIVPGRKAFTEADANWISGGATSFAHVPYLLRLEERPRPLQGTLLAALRPRLPRPATCGSPGDCLSALGVGLLDRSLAGLNRVMERGVEPIARRLNATDAVPAAAVSAAPPRPEPSGAVAPLPPPLEVAARFTDAAADTLAPSALAPSELEPDRAPMVTGPPAAADAPGPAGRIQKPEAQAEAPPAPEISFPDPATGFLPAAQASGPPDAPPRPIPAPVLHPDAPPPPVLPPPPLPAAAVEVDGAGEAAEPVSRLPSPAPAPHPLG